MPWNARRHIRDFRRGFRTEGSFTQNLAITFSGNVLAQLIGFLITPFIARIYGPEAYGVFALFIALVNNLAPLSTLQLPSGYVTAKDDDEFFRLVKITLLILLSTTFFYSVVIYLYQYEFTNTFDADAVGQYLFLVPVYFLLMGLDQILAGWNIRLVEFKRGATAKIFSTIASKGATIVFGIFVQPTALGIIIGNLLSYPFDSFVKLGPRIQNGVSRIFNPVTWPELKAIYQKFKGYVFFVTPGLFVSNLSSQLPVYYFSLTFNSATVGLFALANSFVNLPLSLVINSSTTVFLQKAAETMHRSQEELKELVEALYKKLFFVSFFPLALLAFISEWVFSLLFGALWEQSGLFAAFLCISAVMNVTNTPLTVLYRLLHYEKINFFIHVFFTGIKFIGLWVGVYYNDILLSVIGYSIASLLACVCSLFIIFRLVKLSYWILLRDTVLVGLLVLVIIFFKT